MERERDGADPPPPPSPATDLIEVVFDGRSVSLIVRPPRGDQPAATPEEAATALRRGPFSAVSPQTVADVVAAQSGEPALIGEVPVPADAAGWFVVISPDALAAYLVPAPTSVVADDAEAAPSAEESADEDSVAGPAQPPASSDAIAKRLRELEVKRGVIDEVVAAFDPPRVVEAIECVALGQPPVGGRNAIIEILVAGGEEEHAPVTRDDGTVDHHATLVSRFVEQGAVIATRVPPVEGTPGIDVSGKPIDPRAVTDQSLDALAGQHTEVQGDQLVTINPGRPTRNGERFDVLPSYEVPGDLNYAVGNIEFEGDVLVRGDVKPGFSIDATGSVVVGVVLEQATIRAGGDVSVQGVIGSHEAGVAGDAEDGGAAITAGGDIDAQYLHTISVRAEGEVRVNREIVNCTVRASRVLTPPSGRIVGGDVTADFEIGAGSLGSNNGARTQLQIATHRAGEALVVRAWGTAQAGVKLNVRGAILDIEDALPSASFWQLEGDVVRLDGFATLQDIINFAEETDRRPPSAPSADDEEDAAA